MPEAVDDPLAGELGRREVGRRGGRHGDEQRGDEAADHGCARLPLLAPLEVERGGVDAVAQPSGARAVGEDVAQVRAARSCTRPRCGPSVAGVRAVLDRVAGGGLVARPAGARLELRARVEERLATDDAPVGAVLVVVRVPPGERPLCGPPWVTAYCSGVRRSRSSARRSSDISSLPVDAGSVQSGWSHRRAALRLLAPVAAILALLTGAVIAAALTAPTAPAPADPPGGRVRPPTGSRARASGRAGRGRARARRDPRRSGPRGGHPHRRPDRDPDPAATAGAWVVHRLIVAAVGLEPERLGLQALATDDGRSLPLPPNFGSEVLARELRPGAQPSSRRARAVTRRARAPGQPGRHGRPGEGDHRRGPPQAGPLPRHPAAVDERRAPRRRARALAQVGQPYVWGGEWPSPASPRGPQAHGASTAPAWPGGRSPPARRAARRRSRRPARPDHGGRHGLGAAARAGPDRRARTRRPRLLRRPRPPVAARTISHSRIVLGNGWMVHASGRAAASR